MINIVIHKRVKGKYTLIIPVHSKYLLYHRHIHQIENCDQSFLPL